MGSFDDETQAAQSSGDEWGPGAPGWSVDANAKIYEQEWGHAPDPNFCAPMRTGEMPIVEPIPETSILRYYFPDSGIECVTAPPGQPAPQTEPSESDAGGEGGDGGWWPDWLPDLGLGDLFGED